MWEVNEYKNLADEAAERWLEFASKDSCDETLCEVLSWKHPLSPKKKTFYFDAMWRTLLAVKMPAKVAPPGRFYDERLI